jgi:hypothetical protein
MSTQSEQSFIFAIHIPNFDCFVETGGGEYQGIFWVETHMHHIVLMVCESGHAVEIVFEIPDFNSGIV